MTKKVTPSKKHCDDALSTDPSATKIGVVTVEEIDISRNIADLTQTSIKKNTTTGAETY